MKNRHTLFSILIIVTLLSSAAPRLVQVITLARHGARTPIKYNYKANEYDKPRGEMTTLGHVQTYHLGREIRHRYVYEHGLLSPNYTPEEILIRSSYKARAIESAIAMLNGLFEHQKPSPQPIKNQYTSIDPEKLLPLKDTRIDIN
mmetsp:Transcript_22260/g.19103  ORF Transcript_22260/g.19103 Transcript_22260/m.19103 type:complete len:146 (+) Transcript_22260:94-531(+)